MIGSPMDASGFTGLAARFRDRTVVTDDPRGAGRSERAETGTQSTPEQHADDLHRLIDALGAGPVDIFASSGERSTRWRWSPGTPAWYARWWRTSRRPHRSCRTASTR